MKHETYVGVMTFVIHGGEDGADQYYFETEYGFKPLQFENAAHGRNTPLNEKIALCMSPEGDVCSHTPYYSIIS